ncbi:hypothetical protein [Pseudodonghicola flavimaris]|uniref:Uncharacterized protein n=1 Tax=Pseudodonghicola flavimaris TaxID=3050036 RepID=A0ABT7EVP0_9RHOB|nr:hypothetical protein [Pseudodonghicola flavimaris]MDK3016403.1 hypothetical protein [Pseudodonghicola flavimaris]
MARILKDLLLALLNATLILAAVCLFLFWKASGTARSVMEDFVGTEQIVGPLRDDLRTLNQELEDLRATLARLEWDETEDRPAALLRLDQRLATLDARMEVAQTRLTTLANMPTRMMDRAVETGVDRFMDRADAWRSCPQPGQSGN